MIKDISFEECMTLWKDLWKDRVSPIEQTSAMVLITPEELNAGITRLYSNDVGLATFMGFYDGDLLVGVNSFHRIGITIRSRGLYVCDSHRGKGIAGQLLGEVIRRAPEGFTVWSYPKDNALPVYLKAGFEYYLGPLKDEVENKVNHYVKHIKR
jgi:GNAT superfamily N-acetyltransferase